MLEPGPAARDRFLNQVFDDRAAFGPQEARVAGFAELMSSRRVSNDEPANAAVANEHVRAEPEDEIGNSCLSRRDDGIRQRIGRGGLVE